MWSPGGSACFKQTSSYCLLNERIKSVSNCPGQPDERTRWKAGCWGGRWDRSKGNSTQYESVLEGIYDDRVIIRKKRNWNHADFLIICQLANRCFSVCDCWFLLVGECGYFVWSILTPLNQLPWAPHRRMTQTNVTFPLWSRRFKFASDQPLCTKCPLQDELKSSLLQRRTRCDGSQKLNHLDLPSPVPWLDSRVKSLLS